MFFSTMKKNEGPRAFPPNNGAASIVPISGFVLNRGKSTASSPQLPPLSLLVDIIDRKNFVFQSPALLFSNTRFPWEITEKRKMFREARALIIP